MGEESKDSRRSLGPRTCTGRATCRGSVEGPEVGILRWRGALLDGGAVNQGVGADRLGVGVLQRVHSQWQWTVEPFPLSGVAPHQKASRGHTSSLLASRDAGVLALLVSPAAFLNTLKVVRALPDSLGTIILTQSALTGAMEEVVASEQGDGGKVEGGAVPPVWSGSPPEGVQRAQVEGTLGYWYKASALSAGTPGTDGDGQDCSIPWAVVPGDKNGAEAPAACTSPSSPSSFAGLVAPFPLWLGMSSIKDWGCAPGCVAGGVKLGELGNEGVSSVWHGGPWAPSAVSTHAGAA
eukprot:3276277-Rhodomonas_salina.2